ncbi:MAG: hypothetical protein ABI837_11555, partial [Acidobacteriota bacterium]
TSGYGDFRWHSYPSSSNVSKLSGFGPLEERESKDSSWRAEVRFSFELDDAALLELFLCALNERSNHFRGSTHFAEVNLERARDVRPEHQSHNFVGSVVQFQVHAVINRVASEHLTVRTSCVTHDFSRLTDLRFSGVARDTEW